jgi:hypothetical protein
VKASNFFVAFFYELRGFSIVVLYLPSVYIIEVYGINRAFSLISALTTLGLWLVYFEMPTLGVIFINIGIPFVINCITKVGGAWFGPRGRNLATMILLFGVYSGETINEFLDENFARAIYYLAILSSCALPLTLILNQSYPEFSPTLSEEEKMNDKKKYKFNLRNQLADLLKDRNFIYIAIASGMILVANETIHSVLSIIFFDIYVELVLNESYLNELYDVCTCVGLLTFGTALYSKFNLLIGFKYLVY